jgi:hypothetical protein
LTWDTSTRSRRLWESRLHEYIDRGQAALWTGGGALVGATLGVGAKWVVGSLAAKATATTTTVGVGKAAMSPQGQVTIRWLEEQMNRVQHIMAPKHLWDRLVTLTGDKLHDYRLIQPFIERAIRYGQASDIGRTREGNVVRQFVHTVNGEEVWVMVVELARDTYQIINAWVKR